MQVCMVVISHQCKMPSTNFHQLSNRAILGVHFESTSWWSLHGQSQYGINHTTVARNQY